MTIAIAGAGAIGCFTGGLLAAAGRDVTFLGRPRLAQEVAAHGLHLTDFAGLDSPVPGVTIATDPGVLARADLILVCVKTAATAEIARAIADHAPPSVPVVSLQNGLEAAETLISALPGRDIRAGVVPFNVVPTAPGRFHRATSGDILIGAGPVPLGAALSVPHLRVTETPQIAAYQWGKLLLNLNNALNALSGLPLRAQLLSRPWRRLMADQMAEALTVLRAHGIAPRMTTPLPAALIPPLMRLPTPLFARIAASMLTIDSEARTSMAYDLAAGRPTEIDAFQGRIAAMGAAKALPTPIATRVAAAIASGASDLTPAELRP